MGLAPEAGPAPREGRLAMEFVRVRKTTRYLDPRSGFRDEVRIDS